MFRGAALGSPEPLRRGTVDIQRLFHAIVARLKCAPKSAAAAVALLGATAAADARSVTPSARPPSAAATEAPQLPAVAAARQRLYEALVAADSRKSGRVTVAQMRGALAAVRAHFPLLPSTVRRLSAR